MGFGLPPPREPGSIPGWRARRLSLLGFHHDIAANNGEPMTDAVRRHHHSVGADAMASDGPCDCDTPRQANGHRGDTSDPPARGRPRRSSRCSAGTRGMMPLFDPGTLSMQGRGLGLASNQGGFHCFAICALGRSTCWRFRRVIAASQQERTRQHARGVEKHIMIMSAGARRLAHPFPPITVFSCGRAWHAYYGSGGTQLLSQSWVDSVILSSTTAKFMYTFPRHISSHPSAPPHALNGVS